MKYFFFSCPFEKCVHQILTLEKWETFHLSGIYYHANMFFENKEKNLKIHHNFLQHERVLKIYVLSIFECRQICVNVLMDDCHLSNITKLKKNNTALGRSHMNFSGTHMLPKLYF
jgi:hypothetical protein